MQPLAVYSTPIPPKESSYWHPPTTDKIIVYNKCLYNITYMDGVFDTWYVI